MPDSGIIIATEPAESEEDWIQEETQHMGAAYKTSIRCRSLALRMLLDLQSGSVIEARAQPNLVAKILKFIKYYFDVQQLPSRASPSVLFVFPDPQPDFSDSYYL